ncbi:SAV_2336 N-terminal domain-related protein [Streptomyces luteogriseus]|uniref:SAV_2336 N-terminal domain-related protein n=1 Tax=Streptomyces luteogriseus TaxID=68233 RepID=UPI0038152D73
MADRSLTELIDRLRRSGLHTDAESLADAVWLARWMGPTTRSTRPQDGPAADPGPRSSAPGEDPSAWPPDPHPLPPGLLLPSPAVDPPRHVPPVAVPQRGSLPGALGLQRELRVLQRYRSGSSPRRFALDEEATAEISARAGLTMPVLAPTTRRTASVQLLIDSSSSMVVWERVAEEMLQVLSRTGAFHDARVHWLHQTPDGRPVVAAGRSGDRPRPVEGIVDPTGDRFTLVITDGAGPLWRSGAGQRLLHRLAAQSAPVAVLQPLPQRLWGRTALSPRPGKLFLSGPGGRRCTFVPEHGAATHQDGLPVPVLPLSPQALGRWARWVSGGPRSVRGAAVAVLRDHPATPRGPERVLAAEDRVNRFCSGASPTAQRLAVYLAAAPLVLPVMVGVHAMTTRSATGPSPLAEVLLGGLLSHANPAGTEGETWYDFAPGVRELLLERLAKDEAVLVLKFCSAYVEQNFGGEPPNFTAMAADQLSGTDAPPLAEFRPSAPGRRQAGVPAPFAAVAAEVVRRFTPDRLRAVPVPDEQLAAARELLTRYSREQDGRALWTAVQELRVIVTGPPGPHLGEANLELAEALLALHRWNPDPALLDEADQAAERTLGPPVPPGPIEGRARFVWGRLRTAQARDREEAGDLGGAEDLLDFASTELDRATRGVTDPETLLAAVLERARVLELLAGLRDSSLLLREAVGSLRTMARVQTLWAPRSADVPLQLGRLLLTIARTTADGKEAQEFAVEAVEELASARELLGAEPDGPGRAAGLLLDLAEAQDRAGADADTVSATLTGAEQALQFAAGPRVSPALRIARMYRALSDRRPGAYESACDVLARTASQASAEDPGLAPLLEEWGDMLLTSADTEERVTAAVNAFRGAVRAARQDTRERARRLVLLGRALHARFRRAGDRTDLREADQVLTRAVSMAYDPAVAARGWYERGQVLLDLGRLLQDAGLQRQAAGHLLRAGRVARDAGDAPLAARARHAHDELIRQLRS